MKKIEYLKSVNGVCHTSCPHHDFVMIGSAKCEECIYCKEIHSISELNHYVVCRFDEFADEKKETQTNSFGNRLKIKAKGIEEVGYIDGYVNEGGLVYAIVYYPLENGLKAIRISDLYIINEGE